MTRTLSNAHRVEIVAGPGVPYDLPSVSGQVMDLGDGSATYNTAVDVRPGNYSTTQFKNSLMSSFSGGVFNPYYGTHGAYILASTGGHGADEFTDAVIFDISTGRWSRLQNANGHTSHPNDYEDAELTQDIYREIIGASPPQIPGPIHQYLRPTIIPPAWSGGPNGSFVSACGHPSRLGPASTFTKEAPHKMQLSTGLWTRASTNGGWPSAVFSQGANLMDNSTGRIYGFSHPLSSFGANTLRYLDLADNQIKGLAFSGSSFTSSMTRPCPFFDPTRNLMIVKTDNPIRFMAFDLANLAGGYTTLSFTGTVPGSDGQQWSFHHCPADDCFYMYEGEGANGSSLLKLTPPASNPLVNQWVVTRRALNSTPRQVPGAASCHYTRFCPVPSLGDGIFLWIADADVPAQLIKV